MTIIEAQKELIRLQDERNKDEFDEILSKNLDLQYAFDFINDTSKEKTEMKSQGLCADYNPTCTGFSLRSMSAYRSQLLNLKFNPFDLHENHEWYWLLHPWEDEFNCFRNLAASLQRLARRFQLQDGILSLSEYDSLFSLSKDCYMAILGVMDEVTEADDFLVGLFRYSELNHLTMCYLLNGYNNLKQHYELIAGGVALLYQSLGAEFVTSSFGGSEQHNHNSVPYRVVALSSSQLKLGDEECSALIDRVKNRPDIKTMSNDITNSLDGLVRMLPPTDFCDIRSSKMPREAELFMRLGESFAPELLRALLVKLKALVKNLFLLKSEAEAYQNRPHVYVDAFMELKECYERSESYKEDLLDFLFTPAMLDIQRLGKEQEQAEIDDFFLKKYKRRIVLENEVYKKCGELLQIDDGHWPQLMEVINNIDSVEGQFRMYMVYMSYDFHLLNDIVRTWMGGAVSGDGSNGTQPPQSLSSAIVSCFSSDLLDKQNPNLLFLLLLALYARKLRKRISIPDFVDYIEGVYSNLYDYYGLKKKEGGRDKLINSINNLKKKSQLKFATIVMDQASLMAYVDSLYKPKLDGNRTQDGEAAHLLANKLFLKLKDVILD